MQLDYFTPDDYDTGTCLFDHIGKAKPSHMQSVKPNADLVQDELGALCDSPEVTPQDLRQDVLSAYKQLGGTKFLMQNPALLQKLLVKMVGETKQTSSAPINVSISWLTPDRLAYRQGVVDIAPAIAGNQMIESAAVPWKAKPAEGLATILREDQK